MRNPWTQKARDHRQERIRVLRSRLAVVREDADTALDRDTRDDAEEKAWHLVQCLERLGA